MSLSQTVKSPGGNRTGRERWDVVVIGCGVMGAAASYNLALKGLRVLNIERFGVGHDKGSSHGRTRIIRLTYYEDPRYVPLLRRAYDSWKEVESRSGKTLLTMTGGLMIGRRGGELIEGATMSAKAHGLPFTALDASEVNSRFEAFKLPDELVAVHDPSAGVLSAEESVRSFVGLASERGCEFRFSEEVKGWKSDAEGITIETSLGTHRASKVVFCAGSWNSGLLGSLVPIVCERQVPLWFPSSSLGRFSPSAMPVFMVEGASEMFYGIPDFGHGVKVARHHGGTTGPPDAMERSVSESDIAPVASFIQQHMNGLGHTPIDSTTCLYSDTPDLNFVLGPHPSEPRVTVAGGFSGHGFKFASVVGELVAGMVIEEKLAYDVSFLRPDRFARRNR